MIKGGGVLSVLRVIYSIYIISLWSGGYEPFWYKNEERTIKRTLRHKVSFEKNMHKVSDCAKQFMEGGQK